MEWIRVGTLTRLHGLKGELKFRPDFTAIAPSFKRAHVEGDDPEIPGPKVHSVRGHADKKIIKLEGIDNPEDAQTLAGRGLIIPAEDFPPLPENEYYWFQVLGLNVFDEDGVSYGTVADIIETGANDVYVVKDGERELLLPVIDSVIKEINLEEHKLIFHVIEGLLEDDQV